MARRPRPLFITFLLCLATVSIKAQPDQRYDHHPVSIVSTFQIKVADSLLLTILPCSFFVTLSIRNQ